MYDDSGRDVPRVWRPCVHVEVLRGGDVHDVKEVAAAHQMLNGPLAGLLSLLAAVHCHHQVALVFVVPRLGWVELRVSSMPTEVRLVVVAQARKIRFKLIASLSSLG